MWASPSIICFLYLEEQWETCVYGLEFHQSAQLAENLAIRALINNQFMITWRFASDRNSFRYKFLLIFIAKLAYNNLKRKEWTLRSANSWYFMNIYGRHYQLLQHIAAFEVVDLLATSFDTPFINGEESEWIQFRMDTMCIYFCINLMLLLIPVPMYHGTKGHAVQFNWNFWILNYWKM